jgi:hypothetical protein
LTQRRAVIGQSVLISDQCDAALETLSSQCLGAPPASQARADDRDVAYLLIAAHEPNIRSHASAVVGART